MAFAVSENERWSNNATNEFISFFKIYLAGTEANFDDRFEIIEYGLNKNDTEYEKIIIKSLHQALSDYRFSRMLGAENQGSRAPLKDFEPALNEIIKYRKKCFERLNHIIKKQSNNLEQAKISLAHSYNCMVRIGAVSYTHLRAHETVLDLVCRLLLEKKNNNPNNTTLCHIYYRITHVKHKVIVHKVQNK